MNRFAPFVVIAGLAACTGAPRDLDAMREESDLNMKKLIMGCHRVEADCGEWPDRISEVKQYVEDYDRIIRNPLTGDDPGYEYVKPVIRDESIAVMYQLRDGKRDMSLSLGYMDASVREPDE